MYDLQAVRNGPKASNCRIIDVIDVERRSAVRLYFIQDVVQPGSVMGSGSLHLKWHAGKSLRGQSRYIPTLLQKRP